MAVQLESLLGLADLRQRVRGTYRDVDVTETRTTLHLVAEGSRGRSSATRCRRFGCRLGQGFLFARPLEGPAFRALLRERQPAGGAAQNHSSVRDRCAAPSPGAGRRSLAGMPDAWIRQWGDAALREVAAPVADIDELLRRRVRRMADRLVEADGAGLAATQVGFLRRVFVYRETRESSVEVLINPRVVASSGERAVFEESCLSFRAVTVAVRRPVAVRVEAVDLEGWPVTIDAEGPLASLMQHEIDHLDGILTLDRAEPAERRRALAVLLGEAVASAA